MSLNMPQKDKALPADMEIFELYVGKKALFVKETRISKKNLNVAL